MRREGLRWNIAELPPLRNQRLRAILRSTDSCLDLSHSASNMPGGGGSNKATANERKYPYIAELPASVGGLDVALGRRIIQFHKIRHVQPRHGRTIPKEGRFYYRWCFSDLQTAHAFIEEFDGWLHKPNR
jgi:hypothetical protein